MRFGRTLRDSVYEPWKSQYIDYAKLKRLLREDDAEDMPLGTRPSQKTHEWSETDESAFTEELLNVQLENVNKFHTETIKHLRKRSAECEATLECYRGAEESRAEQSAGGDDEQHGLVGTLDAVQAELDSITKELNELEKYSRLNYAGFLKAAKKHDRRRGSRYKVRPLLQVRLSALPFNAEDYSPLLYRLSVMYSFTRQRIGKNLQETSSSIDIKSVKDVYKSYKFWVHPENILEVKTYILRRLPVLVYNPQTAKIVEGSQSDPTITSLYFDNEDFLLYNKKVDKASDAQSLRLRWYGQLRDKPEIVLEEKIIQDDSSSELRLPIKDKYVQSFIKGQYRMEKSVEKIRALHGPESDAVAQLEAKAEEIQAFIREHELRPVLRANYTRTAFQVPGDDRVRISVDTNLAFIREDCLDQERPCRAPEEWHRNDIDRVAMDYPFTDIPKGEIARFPYALLEIKVKDNGSKRRIEWISDLMSSHLVKEAPRFSKFVHGVAQLFEDYVNSFPFWLSDLDTDIRRDPEDAFREEQEKRAKEVDDDMHVGSLLGGKLASPLTAAVGSPAGKRFGLLAGVQEKADRATDEQDPDDELARRAGNLSKPRGLRSFLPSFSNSKYARARRRQSVQLPPAVRYPGQFIKDSGEVHVEPKVWLANQRTFIKWQHISVLLASLSLGLYNAAGESNYITRGLAIVYTLVAAFIGLWGLYIYQVRNRMIRARSGKDFDNVVGPIVVCVGLIFALCLNFGFKYQECLTISTAEVRRGTPVNFSQLQIFMGEPKQRANVQEELR